MSDTPIPRPTDRDMARELPPMYHWNTKPQIICPCFQCVASRRAHWAEHDLKEATTAHDAEAEEWAGWLKEVTERAERAEADLKTAKEFARALSRELADEHPDCSNVKAELTTLQARIEWAPEAYAVWCAPSGNDAVVIVGFGATEKQAWVKAESWLQVSREKAEAMGFAGRTVHLITVEEGR